MTSAACAYFLHEYGQNVSSREAAHAPTKYQSNSTSGRGARASYRTMLPEISARRSLRGEYNIVVAWLLSTPALPSRQENMADSS